MATIAGSAADVQSRERRFYSRMAIALVVLMLIGFAPSFFARGYVPSPRPNPSLPPAVLFHGLLFTLWMFVFVVQTQLVANGRRDIHIKLGTASLILAIAIVPVMYLTSVWQVARANQPPMTDPLTWTIVPLAGIIPYALLVWQGWARRKQAQWHKRLMLSAAILFVAGPAIGRLPIVPPTLPGFTFLMLLGLALFVPLFLWDRRTRGEIHPATWLGFGLVAFAHVTPLIVFWSGADWASVAARLPGVGA